MPNKYEKLAEPGKMINNTFTFFELQEVGNHIIRELEGMISDSLLNKEK